MGNVISVDTEILREAIDKIAGELEELTDEAKKIHNQFTEFDKTRGGFKPAASGVQVMVRTEKTLAHILDITRDAQREINTFADDMAGLNKPLRAAEEA